MCGIFGVISFNGNAIDKEKVLAARDVLAHRGPDDAGVYFSPNNERSLAFARDDTSTGSVQAASTGSAQVASTGSVQSAESDEINKQERSFTIVQDDNAKTVFVALAHRRLSIIDLSPAAHQPMSTPDHRYTIVFNGEIYNYRSLIPSPSPKEKGVFKSNSDTEVILYLYEKYGKKCLKFLRGMFAFAIWDDKEKTLFAARDRFGIKPFYFYDDGSEFIFSSELKAIKHYKGNLTINNDALDAFLRTGSVPAPMTIYKEVKALMPGNFLECQMSNVKCQKYWGFGDLFGKSAVDNGQLTNGEIQLSAGEVAELQGDVASKSSAQSVESDEINKQERSFTNVQDDRPNKPRMTKDKHQGSSTCLPVGKVEHQPHKLKYDTTAKKIIREALLDTIRAHMVADVEVGAFLSGGIDSTAIVSLMRQVGKEKIKTVSIVFPDSRFDESKYSRLAAIKYNTEHIEIPFYEKDLLNDFENIMAVMDQPTIDGINTYFVSKAARQAGLKVVLSGLGGDELFGGYPSFNLIPKLWKIKKIPFAKLFMKAVAPLLKHRLPAKAIEYLRNPDVENAEYRLVRGLFTKEELRFMGWDHATMHTYNHSKVMSENGWMHDDAWMHDNGWKYSLVNVTYLESCNYMRNQLLRDSDVFSMAHSIELRVPFVDHLLYAAVLPYLDDAYDKNFPKKMLVEAVGDIPDEIIHRPKMGFTFPFEDWIRNGQLKNDIMNSFNKLNQHFNFYPMVPEMNPGQAFDLDKIHWSRLWALFILNRYV